VSRRPLIGSVLSLSLGLSLATPTVGCIHSKDRSEGYGTAAPAKAQTVEAVPVKGHRVWLRQRKGPRLVGELLYVGALETGEAGEGEVAVLDDRGRVVTMPRAALRRATILVDPNARWWLTGIGSTTAVLVPVTLATGIVFMYLMPAVGIAGVVAMGIAWGESRVILRDDDLGVLYEYARWPQGRPVLTAPEAPAMPAAQDEEPERRPVPPAAPIELMPLD